MAQAIDQQLQHVVFVEQGVVLLVPGHLEDELAGAREVAAGDTELELKFNNLLTLKFNE